MLTDSDQANDEIEREFDRWAREIALAEKLRTMRMARAQDGEAFGILVNNPVLDYAVKLDLRLIEADLAKARKEWQDALGEARRKREAKEAEGPAPMEGPEDLLTKVRGSLSGLGDLLQTAKERAIGVAGTFNAAALLGLLQAGGADERIASATERTAKGVEGLRQDVRNNRAAFT